MKFLLHLLFVCLSAGLCAQDLKKVSSFGVPGKVIAYSPQSSGLYIGSPSICILPNGNYLASHDLFGPNSAEFEKPVSKIYRSANKGKTWEQVAEINGQFWSKLFIQNGKLYFLGTDKHHGNAIIRTSIDNGNTWTDPVDENNGLLLQGEYHCAPMPFVEHNGRLWRAMEDASGEIKQWGKRYGTFMMNIDKDADLMKASNWQHSNVLLYDSTMLLGSFNAWIEGNAVLTPEGNIVNILRVNSRRTDLQEKAAVVRVSADGKVSSFDTTTGFINFPGGGKKFTIRQDQATGLYWTVANYVPDSIREQHPNRNPGSIRNTQVLFSSKDLKTWDAHKILLQHADVVNHGFQYIDWVFDGKDIIFASRTAYDDGVGGARNNHDANFLTFHRIKNFRKTKPF